MSDSLQPRGLQHARLPCRSLSPRVCTNSCSSNHLILCCPLLLLPSAFLSIRVFSSELAFHISGQSIRGFSFSISPSNGYSCWFPVGLTGLNSLQSKGLTRVFSSTTIWKHQFFGAQPSLWSSSHIRTWLVETPKYWHPTCSFRKICHLFKENHSNKVSFS